MRGKDIKSNFFHDAGAYARCSYCGRYSDDPRSIQKADLMCDCGKTRGWCGSFKLPTETAIWNEGKVER